MTSNSTLLGTGALDRTRRLLERSTKSIERHRTPRELPDTPDCTRHERICPTRPLRSRYTRRLEFTSPERGQPRTRVMPGLTGSSRAFRWSQESWLRRCTALREVSPERSSCFGDAHAPVPQSCPNPLNSSLVADSVQRWRRGGALPRRPRITATRGMLRGTLAPQAVLQGRDNRGDVRRGGRVGHAYLSGRA